MTPRTWRITLKRRAAVIAGCLVAWVVGIEARLVYLQVISHADFEARAERQQNRTLDAPAKRGDIVDRLGHVLATSVDADTVYAVPSELTNPADVVVKLCAAFRDCQKKERQSLLERLNSQRQFAYVRRQIAPDVAQRVADLNLEGVGFLKESKRFYPNRELAAHLLGWVGIDNVGLGGLESTYDAEIRGRNGKILIQTDARRRVFKRDERLPTAGSSVELTIDEYLQYIAERELHAGVIENRALGGSAVILNPATGEILAMANEPTFNPNAYRDSEDIDRRNRVVQDIYEPGSTMKIVTASAAIQEHVFRPDALIDTNPGAIKFGSRPAIHEDGNRNYGVLSFTDVLVKSSNIGAIKIGLRVGAQRLGLYAARYGLGKPSSPDFPSESPGIVWNPDKLTDSALASMSMGYQVSVTALQMASVVSAVANGGELIEPRVLRAIYRDDRRIAVRPKVIGRTVDQETASTLTTIMEQVVERGTAKRAKIAGYTIAGKTGTAQKIINGRYSHTDHVASFVGFVPSRRPALAMVVVIDSAKGPNGDHGGSVAAPVFQRIAEASLRYLGVPPDLNPAPPVLVAVGHGDSAPRVVPADVTPQAKPRLIVNQGLVPDVRGMAARDALRALLTAGLTARMSGDGVVVSQVPAPGEAFDAGDTCRLVLERASYRAPEVGHP
jgi:cell division protein FtsI (penicillin-binding protein 3)